MWVLFKVDSITFSSGTKSWVQFKYYGITYLEGRGFITNIRVGDNTRMGRSEKPAASKT